MAEINVRDKIKGFINNPILIKYRIANTTNDYIGYKQIFLISEYYKVDMLVASIYCQGNTVLPRYKPTSKIYGTVMSDLTYIERYLKVRKIADKIELNNY